MRRPFPATRDLPVILSDREIRELLKVCVDLKEKILIGILCDTGMRTSEVLKLRLYDLDFDRSTVHIRDGKGHRDRYVPFSSHAPAHLWLHASDGRRECPTDKPRKRKNWSEICLARGHVMDLCPFCGTGIMYITRCFPRIRSPERTAV